MSQNNSIFFKCPSLFKRLCVEMSLDKKGCVAVSASVKGCQSSKNQKMIHMIELHWVVDRQHDCSSDCFPNFQFNYWTWHCIYQDTGPRDQCSHWVVDREHDCSSDCFPNFQFNYWTWHCIYQDTGPRDQCSQLVVATLIPSTPIYVYFSI